ncbi:MAG: hypothetical protein HKL81_05165 [Acidimicrobiaceae bacterium]|nr:hypothetical protein [Acidimicrobiaceae bacterium]
MADYVWMYEDGLGVSNLSCTSINTASWWAHRLAILVTALGGNPSAGVGSTAGSRGSSAGALAALVVPTSSGSTGYSLTWSEVSAQSGSGSLVQLNTDNAAFYGSPFQMTLNRPIVVISSTSGGKGHWVVASDGGAFSS